ncbi:SusD/RagB family nutrient-binding outer membrane lipoprotein [Pedobacter sp. NJ-S-72]
MRLTKYTICLILCLALTSCKKGFQELNVNPNTSEKALPQALLAPAITNIVKANMSRSQRLANELMQVTVDMGDTDGKVFRYDIRKSEGDYLWNSWYLELSNFNDIYKGAEQLSSNSFKGISLICQAYVFSLLTDTYGDIPYFNATKAKEGIFMPEFDRQEVIYPELFKKLEMANELLKTGTNIPSSSDPLYAGNAANWRKFGNTLYLRLLMRISAKSPAVAVAKIKDIVDVNSSNYPIISSNAESAALRWSGTAPYVSPFPPGDLPIGTHPNWLISLSTI